MLLGFDCMSVTANVQLCLVTVCSSSLYLPGSSDCMLRDCGLYWITHYENKPIRIYRKFHLQKLKKIQINNCDIFHISAQNIGCGYSLERRGGSNEYTQSMF